MKVRELITHLQTFDPELPICYQEFSEYTELEAEYIRVKDLQPPRGDGYVGSQRPDKPTQLWLVFPGN